MEKRTFRFPLWVKLIVYTVLIAVDVLGLITIFRMGSANAAVFFGMAFTLLIWPLFIRGCSTRLYAIRREYVEAVRADLNPCVSIPQVMLLYAAMMSPSFLFAFISLAIPWGLGAMGFFFVPALVLLILFGILHGSVWTDVGLRRIWYILYLAGLFLASTGAGLLVSIFV